MTGTRYCTTQMLDSCNWVRGHFKLNVSRNYGYSKKWIVGQMPLGTKANQRAQLSAGMSASLDMYAQDIGVDVIPNWLFLFRSIFVGTSWPLYKHISSQSEMPVVSAPPPPLQTTTTHHARGLGVEKGLKTVDILDYSLLLLWRILTPSDSRRVWRICSRSINTMIQ